MFEDVVPPEAVRHFCHVATARLGVDIGVTHHALVAGRVAKRLQALQVGLDEYMERLDDDRECSEVVGLLDFLRPRPPRFFARPDDHVTLHARLVRCLQADRRRFRLWSAGCGTGEEAYSMALTALGAAQASQVDLGDIDIKILATDISKPILERGRQGVFDEEQLRDVPRSLRSRYFHATEHGLAIDKNLRAMVYFRRLSLTSLPYPMSGPLDAIFCPEGLAPLVPSARKRVAAAISTLLADEGVSCTGFSDQELGALDGEEAPLGPSGSGTRPRRQGHC